MEKIDEVREYVISTKILTNINIYNILVYLFLTKNDIFLFIYNRE